MDLAETIQNAHCSSGRSACVSQNNKVESSSVRQCFVQTTQMGRGQGMMNGRRADSWSDELVCRSVQRLDYFEWILLYNVAPPSLRRLFLFNIVSWKNEFTSLGLTSQQLTVHNLPNHPSPEVRHVFLGIKGGVSWHISAHHSDNSSPAFMMSYLCECDWLVFGNVICIFACEHSTVTAVHLLWDFLIEKQKCYWTWVQIIMT